MLTLYAQVRAEKVRTSVVKAWFFVAYRLSRIVPDPLDTLAGMQLAVKMWEVGLKSPDAYSQEMLLDYLFDELCGYALPDGDEPPPEMLHEMFIHLNMRFQELGAARLAITSHGKHLPADYTESLWGAADGVISVWERVGSVAEEYERQTGERVLPDAHVDYIIQSCFVDYLWMFMEGDKADIDRLVLFQLICRFPHEAKWQRLFQRLMDEGHFDRETVEGLLDCQTLPTDESMVEAAECVVFWRNEAVDEPLPTYLSNYLAAEAVG
jgi:hypothetical protein